MTAGAQFNRFLRDGFILLEVVVAVGLLVLGLTFIGAQIQSSLMTTLETDRLARVVFLAESLLADLDSGGLIKPNEALEAEREEEFGRLFPEYGWRMRLDLTNDEEMIWVQMDILHDAARYVDEEFDFERAELVQTFYTLRVVPRPLDLTTDFGMDDEVADKLNEDLSSIGGGGIDANNFDPSVFRDLDLQDMGALISALMRAFDASPQQILALVPEEMRPQVEALFAGDASDDGGDTGDDGSGTGPAEESGDPVDDGGATDSGDMENTGDDGAAPDDGAFDDGGGGKEGATERGGRKRPGSRGGRRGGSRR